LEYRKLHFRPAELARQVRPWPLAAGNARTAQKNKDKIQSNGNKTTTVTL